MKKAFGRLKTIGGEENIIAGCVICEENPDPSSYTELVGVEPRLEISGKKYNDSSQSVSEENFLPVYKPQVETFIKPATDEFNKWKEIHATAVENGMPDAILENLVAKKNEASEKLQEILNQWDAAE